MSEIPWTPNVPVKVDTLFMWDCVLEGSGETGWEESSKV